jgi:thiamine-monophosphate kinase
VSGRLGEAELGLALVRKSERRVDSRDPILRKHLYPEPRLALGRWLAERRLASAMMDLSDGLSTDLPRLCAANKVGARIEAEKLPAVLGRKGVQSQDEDSLHLALHGGDEYELLFTVPRKKMNRIPRSVGGVPLTAIGKITKEGRLRVVERSGREVSLPNRGWDPFRQRR